MLFARSVDIKNPPSFSFANFPSSVLFVKSPMNSSLICDFSHLPSVLFKSLSSLTSSSSLKIPTCAPFTPSVSPFVRRCLFFSCLTFLLTRHTRTQRHPACSPPPGRTFLEAAFPGYRGIVGNRGFGNLRLVGLAGRGHLPPYGIWVEAG